MAEPENGLEKTWRPTSSQGSYRDVGNRAGGSVAKRPRCFRCQSIYTRSKKPKKGAPNGATQRQDATKTIQCWARRTRQLRVYRRLLAHVVVIQAAWRGADTRRHLAMNRAAAHRQARRRQIYGMISDLVALAIAVAIMVGLIFGGASPCQRGDTLSRGDAPLAPGECIESATGSRLFGWIPGVSAKARLSVVGDGRLLAKKPDGAEVVLAGDIPIDGRKWDLLCGAERLAHIVSGKDEPSYGAQNARGQLVLGKEYHCWVYRTSGPKGVRGRLDAWLQHGGHVGFSPDGDLKVVSSKGSVWWSLAKELTEDDSKKSRTGSAEPSRGRKEDKRKDKEIMEKNTKMQTGRKDGDKSKRAKKRAPPEPGKSGREGGGTKWPWNR